MTMEKDANGVLFLLDCLRQEIFQKSLSFLFDFQLILKQISCEAIS